MRIRKKVNYFDMDTICDVKAPSWSGEDVTPFSDFLRAYADFVLQRTTQFGPGFAELLVRWKELRCEPGWIYFVPAYTFSFVVEEHFVVVIF